jgi:uncharacterized protein
MNRADVLRRIRRAALWVLGVLLLLVLVLAACALYAVFVEPYWLAVRTVELGDSPRLRVVHISDIHFKGDLAYLKKVVAAVNATDADLVCFTGDIVEEPEYLDEALTILAEINKPLFGIPGNHDSPDLDTGERTDRAFRQTGGRWLTARGAYFAEANVALVVLADLDMQPAAGNRDLKRILLVHNPAAVEQLHDRRFDLILAGHTHGGQVRIPLIGKALLPYDVGKYDRGLFSTDAGPLYVHPGIGTFYANVRFGCRPEITLIEL